MKSNWKVFVTVVALIPVLSCCGGREHNVPDTDPLKAFRLNVQDYLDAHAANGKFSGSILISKGDSVLFSDAVGKANKPFGVDNSDSTRFLIGSITKPFTAMAVLLLGKQGKLNLDDPLSFYFPEFPRAREVTIRQLLMHTSGITDYHAFPSWREDSQSDRTTPQYTMQKVTQNPFVFIPGERFSYTNSGYILLGLIVEQVSGQPFGSFVQASILEPLGLKHTGVVQNESLVPWLACGYTTNLRESKNASYINYQQPFSSGNMYSTPADLWRFTRAVIQGELLSPEASAEIFTISDRYGYGWGIRDFGGVKAFGHYGRMNGYVGAITYIPEGEYFIGFLTNDDNTPLYTITEDLVSLIWGETIAPPRRIEQVSLTNEMITAVTGDYMVKPGDTLHVFVENDRLYLQETGQAWHELFPIGEFEYAFSLFEFNAVFSNMDSGYMQSLKFVGKSSVVAHRIPLSV